MAAAGVFDLELNDATNDQNGSSDVSDEEQITVDEDQVRVCCAYPAWIVIRSNRRSYCKYVKIGTTRSAISMC